MLHCIFIIYKCITLLLFIGTCNPVSATATFDPSTAFLTISVGLCGNAPCGVNPCPGILAPQAMGYDTEFSGDNFMHLGINMVTFFDALSVNLGILLVILSDSDYVNVNVNVFRHS